MQKKLSLEELVSKTDAAKRSNPLDLSSDQDLSIALMNLVSLEEHFFFSGGKSGKLGFYDLINVAREMRKDLMTRIVRPSSAEDGEVWCISKHLLAAAMRLIEVGTKALGAGKKEDAYGMFSRAYELYSLFWGINMNLVDLTGVKVSDNELKISVSAPAACTAPANESAKPAAAARSCSCAAGAAAASIDGKRGLLSGLGQWVKKSVNCCIE
jgi:hypothetical protein